MCWRRAQRCACGGGGGLHGAREGAREGGRECTVGTWVGATVGRGGGRGGAFLEPEEQGCDARVPGEKQHAGACPGFHPEAGPALGPPARGVARRLLALVARVGRGVSD